MSAETILHEQDFVVKAIRFGADKKSDERQVSSKIPIDSFKEDYGDNVIEPPFDLYTLSVMKEASSILGPCVDTMAVNIAKLGYRTIPRDDLAREGEEIDGDVQRDVSILKNFFANAVLEGTLVQFNDKERRDLEETGNSYIEVQESLLEPGKPAGLTHIESWTMRLTRCDSERTYYEVPRAVQNEDNGNWEIRKYPNRKYFRRFVMRKDYGSQKVYFKEWGDPRVISRVDGKVLAESIEKATTEDIKLAANSIIHKKLYCTRSPYGLPRYIGNFFKIYGNRQADIVNYTTLKCNNIPALVLMATNAQLSQGSIDRIKEFVEERIQGDNNYSTMLLLEAEPLTEGMKDPGTMKMELQPLTDVQRDDAMFLNYTHDGDESVRRSFRIPPIYLGLSEEYNRATADASRKLGEEQVFRPERDDDDAVYNTTLVPALGVAKAVYRSNTPNVTDNYELTQLLAVAERSGGLSPHISRIIVEDVLGRDLPRVSEEINPHTPFTLTMLREQAALTQDDNGVEKVLSSDDVVSQLKMLKGMMSSNDGITTEQKKAVDWLISVMESDEVPVLQKSKKIEIPEKTTEKTEKTEKRLTVRQIFKSNEDERIWGGVVLVPGVVDRQGDTYDDDTVEAAAHYWFEKLVEDPDANGIDFMHKGETIHGAAKPIQSYVLDRDMTFEVSVPAADPDHPVTEFEELSYPKGTWILMARIINDDIWEKIKAGELLGWSIGGVATVQSLKSMMAA